LSSCCRDKTFVPTIFGFVGDPSGDPRKRILARPREWPTPRALLQQSPHHNEEERNNQEEEEEEDVNDDECTAWWRRWCQRFEPSLCCSGEIAKKMEERGIVKHKLPALEDDERGNEAFYFILRH
jgi:hypothetical protein